MPPSVLSRFLESVCTGAIVSVGFVASLPARGRLAQGASCYVTRRVRQASWAPLSLCCCCGVIIAVTVNTRRRDQERFVRALHASVVLLSAMRQRLPSSLGEGEAKGASKRERCASGGASPDRKLQTEQRRSDLVSFLHACLPAAPESLRAVSVRENRCQRLGS